MREQVPEISRPQLLAPALLKGRADKTKASRESSTRDRRMKGCHFGHEWAATAHGEQRGLLEAVGKQLAPATSTRRSVRCCTHAVAAETSPGARAK